MKKVTDMREAGCVLRLRWSVRSQLTS